MGALTRLIGLDRLEQAYEEARRLGNAPFEDRALQALDITIASRGLDHIPRQGPVMIVANHPHGALDGLALLTLVGRVRGDVRVLANRMLARVPEMRERCFFVDPFERHGAAERSRAGLRAAHLWLRRGGALIVFPSGEVAGRRGTDAAWKATAGRLAEATRARVVPASIDGGNSPLFYAAGLLHPALRTALLLRELLWKRGSSVAVTFHAPLSRRRGLEPIAAPEPSAALAREIRALPENACLVDGNPLQVFCAEAGAIPQTLREIGRLREATFRAVGEGTGRALDIDAYDRRYLHLFAWDRRAQRLAGAYRLGRADRIVAEYGVEGLYTRSLFQFDARLFQNRPAALELGRSFVCAEYQRHSNALMMLWKGICQFIVRHPQYRLLYGPVSISTRYSDTSHQLLMNFLDQNHRHDSLAEMVQALHPPRPATKPTSAPAPVPASLAEADALIRSTEPDGKGVPVLLRQYLRLNARLIGFNVDPAFGDALDALMMVDLADVDRSILARYVGRQRRSTAAAA